MYAKHRIPIGYWGLTALFFIMLGAGAGFINGLLGTGGGILLVYVMRGCARRLGTGDTSRGSLSERDVYATALSTMLPISVFSAVQYARAGALDLGAFSPFLLPSVAGGLLGGWLLDRLKPDFLKRLFALLVLISGVLMMVR